MSGSPLCELDATGLLAAARGAVREDAREIFEAPPGVDLYVT